MKAGTSLDETICRLECLLEATTDGVAMFDAAGKLLSANRQFMAIYGFSTEELQTLTLEAYPRRLLERVPYEELLTIEDRVARVVSDRLSKVTIEFEMARPAKRRVVLSTVPATDGEGRFVGVVSFHRDVTEERRLQQELTVRADLPDINPYPVFKCDIEGRVQFMNLAAGKLLAELGLSQEKAAAMFPASYREQIRAVVERWSGIHGYLHEYDDHWLSFTFRADPRRPEVMLIVEDVTEHRQADEKIRRYAEELQQANLRIRETQAALVQSEKMASLGNLVAGVAHEINTPVGSMSSNSDVMARALGKLRAVLESKSPDVANDPAVAKLLATLEELGTVNSAAASRIVDIVKSLRNFARLDEAERKKADLHEGLESTLTLVNHELKGRIRVVRNYGDIPEIECYPNQLNQVFMNILVNAAHAIEGEGTITITTKSDGQAIALAFTDSGKGIPSQQLAKIFDPGFTTKGVGVGSGLGLAICYKIVKEHGGGIDVDSELGRGTTFTVTLPVSGSGT